MLILYDACTNADFLTIIKLIKSFIGVIQILVPIGLIIMGSIDFGKAVMAANEDDIKKGQKIFIKRCIGAILVFLVSVIVTFVMGFVGNQTWKACWTASAVAPIVNNNYVA